MLFGTQCTSEPAKTNTAAMAIISDLPDRILPRLILYLIQVRDAARIIPKADYSQLARFLV